MPDAGRVKLRWKILITFLFSAVSLGMVEIVARKIVAANAISRAELLLDADFALYTPHPYLGYSLRAGYSREEYFDGRLAINSMGFRGDEFQQQKPHECLRIVCLGGSTTFSPRVENAKTYPRLLQDKLRSTCPDLQIEVINAGAPGYTSAESLINFQLRVLDLSPDMVVIYHAVNDIHPRVVPGFQADYSHYRKGFHPPEKTVSFALAEWSTLYAYLRHKALVGTRNNIILSTTRVPYLTLPLDEQQPAFANTTAATFRRNIGQHYQSG